MDFYPYFLATEINETCHSESDVPLKRYDCKLIKYGISGAGTPYAEFSRRELDSKTNLPAGEEKLSKMFLWQDKSKKDDQDYYWGSQKHFLMNDK